MSITISIYNTVNGGKGRHQNSLPITTNFSQKFTQPSNGISYPIGDLCDVSQNSRVPVPIHYTVIRYPKQMVQMAFVICPIHFINGLPMFPSMFLSTYCREF